MRVFFRKRAGFRLVRGGHITELQIALGRLVSNPPTVDAVFGDQTERALRVWQSGAGLPATGVVDDITWQGVVGKPPPSIFRRCLALTAAFEGHGYTFAAGNWDGAYVTWGIVGFTLKGGNLGEVIRRIAARHAGLIEDAMGNAKAAELIAIVDASDAKKRAFGNAISRPPTMYRVREDWEDAFAALGNRPEVRAIQDEVAWDVYWRQAVADIRKYGELTELDAGIFFETAVQNGGVNDTKAEKIAAALKANPGAAGRQRLSLIADAIADGSAAAFREDVRSRRQAIARGQGSVHDADYFAEDWGIAELPVSEAELGQR